MKKETTTENEDFEEEIITAKPLIVNNVKTIIGPIEE